MKIKSMKRVGILFTMLVLSPISQTILPEQVFSSTNFKIGLMAATTDCFNQERLDKLNTKMEKHWFAIYDSETHIFEAQGVAADPNPITNTDPDFRKTIASNKKIIDRNSRKYIKILKKYGVIKNIIAKVRKYNSEFINYALLYSTVFNVNNSGGSSSGNEEIAYNELLAAAESLAIAFQEINPSFTENDQFKDKLYTLGVKLSQLVQTYRFGDIGAGTAADLYEDVIELASEIAILLNEAASPPVCV